MKVYHFTDNIREGFAKFYECIQSMGAMVCFDFEDSISTLDADTPIVQARNINRDKILEQLKKDVSLMEYSELGFRINGVQTMNYKEDIKALSHCRNTYTLFIPKVESDHELIKIFNDISFPVNEIIPIIETKQGFDNAKEILSIKDGRYKRIAFGHCDYNLSRGFFPFFHHNSSRYWEWISGLNDICKENGKEIVNSPVLELENENLIHYSNKMCRRFSQVTGHISLCKMHTKALCSDQLITNDCVIDSTEGFLSPELIASAFEKSRIVGKSFAITADRKIISPQERAMAIIKNNN